MTSLRLHDSMRRQKAFEVSREYANKTYAQAASGADEAALNQYRALQGESALGQAARYNSANLLQRQAMALREGSQALCEICALRAGNFTLAQTWFIKLTGGNLVQRLFGGLQSQRGESQHIVQQRLHCVAPFMRLMPAFKQPQCLQTVLVKHTRG